MAQRIKPINIAQYLPSDVAGLQGRRQAVAESDAKVRYESQKMAEAQEFVNTQLRQMESAKRMAAEQQRLALQAQELEANRRQMAHQMRLENAQLGHKIEMDNADLAMKERLLPHEIAAMQIDNMGRLLDNDAQEISNQYAHEREQADLIAKGLTNKINQNRLRDYAKTQAELARLVEYEDAVRRHTESGRAATDFEWEGKPFVTQEGIEGTKRIMQQVAGAASVKQQEKENTDLWNTFDTLKPAQQDVIRKAQQGWGEDPLTGLKMRVGKQYLTSDGKSFSEDGQELISRLARQNKLNNGAGLTPADKQELRGPTTPADWWEDIGDGSIALTEAGLAAYQRREEYLKEPWDEEKRVDKLDSEGNVIESTVEYVPMDKREMDARKEVWNEKQSEHMKRLAEQPELGAFNPTKEERARFDLEARMRAGVEVRGWAEAAREFQKGNRNAYVMDDQQNPRFLTELDVNQDGKLDPDELNVNAAAEGLAGDKRLKREDVEPSPTASDITTLLEGAVAGMTGPEGSDLLNAQNLVNQKDGNIAYPDGQTNISKKKWDKSVMGRQAEFKKQLMQPTSWSPDYSNDKLDRGYGLSESEANEVLDLIKAAFLTNENFLQDSPALAELGTDHNLRHHINWAVDFYAERYANKDRQSLATALGLDNNVGMGAWFGLRAILGNEGAEHEYQEIIHTEVPDAKIKLKGGKTITVRKFLEENRSPQDLKDAEIDFSMAHENFTEWKDPDAPTQGAIHDENRKRFNSTIKLRFLGDSLGTIKRELANSVASADKLKRFEKLMVYYKGEYND